MIASAALTLHQVQRCALLAVRARIHHRLHPPLVSSADPEPIHHRLVHCPALPVVMGITRQRMVPRHVQSVQQVPTPASVTMRAFHVRQDDIHPRPVHRLLLFVRCAQQVRIR
jgi:hypothetical protein